MSEFDVHSLMHSGSFFLLLKIVIIWLVLVFSSKHKCLCNKIHSTQFCKCMKYGGIFCCRNIEFQFVSHEDLIIFFSLQITHLLKFILRNISLLLCGPFIFALSIFTYIFDKLIKDFLNYILDLSNTRKYPLFGYILTSWD